MFKYILVIDIKSKIVRCVFKMRAIWKYVGKRVLYVIPTLIGLSILIFILSRVLPGDPALMAAGPNAPKWVVEQIRHQLRLDKPLWEQYYYWLVDLFHGDLGYSIYTKRSVTVDVVEYLPASLQLIFLAALFEIGGALALGIISGRYAYKLPDNMVRVLAYIGISVPSFVWGLLFQLIFAAIIPLFPSHGMYSYGTIPPPRVTGFSLIDSLIAGQFDTFVDILWHMVLPAFALSLGAMAQDARIIRAGMVDTLQKDHVSLVRAYGIPERTIFSKYILKPSLVPAVTVMGMDIASLLGNAFMVEMIFQWPGFSRYGINVMLNKDINGIVAVVLVIGIIFAIANILVDVVVAYLDPRIGRRSA